MKILSTIKAKRVSLRPLNENDIDSWFEIFSNEEVLRYWGRSVMTEKSEAAERLRSINEEIQSGELFQWGVALNANNKVIGTCMLTNLDMDNRRAEVAYLLNRAFWRQGLMREALIALLNHAFDEINLERLEAIVNVSNEPSIRILEKLCFHREEYPHECWIADNKPTHNAFYILLKKEWQPNY